MRWREWLGIGERRWKRAPDEEVQPGKTLWDWLQLLVVPAILIGVSFAWSASQTRSDNKREDRRSQDATLQAYLDQMSGLMLDKKLLISTFGDPVRAVARTVTLTALRRLDGERQGEVVRFLQEARLLDGRIPNSGGPKVDLLGADLSDANLDNAWLARAYLGNVILRGANLAHADFTDADLRYADLAAANLGDADLISTYLAGTNLTDANLTGADLTDADLTGADLRGANLRDANVQSANLVGAELAGAKNLDLERFITDVPPNAPQEFLDSQKEFLDSQKAFLDSLSPDELAKFNLSPEKLAKLRSQVSEP